MTETMDIETAVAAAYDEMASQYAAIRVMAIRRVLAELEKYEEIEQPCAPVAAEGER